MNATVMPSASMLGAPASAEPVSVAAPKGGEPPRVDDTAFAQVLAAIQGEPTEGATLPAASAEVVEVATDIDAPRAIVPPLEIDSEQLATTLVVAAPVPEVAPDLTVAAIGSSSIVALGADEPTTTAPTRARVELASSPDAPQTEAPDMVAAVAVLDTADAIDAIDTSEVVDATEASDVISVSPRAEPTHAPATASATVTVDPRRVATDPIVVDDAIWTPPAATSTASLDTQAACRSGLPVAPTPTPNDNDMHTTPAPLRAPVEAASSSRPIEQARPFHLAATADQEAPAAEAPAGPQAVDATDLAMPSAPPVAVAFTPPVPVAQQSRPIATDDSTWTPVTTSPEPSTLAPETDTIASASTQSQSTPIATPSAEPSRIATPSLSTPSTPAPAAPIATPSIAAPSIAAPSIVAPSIAAPSIVAPSIAAPSIAAPSIVAPSIRAPSSPSSSMPAPSTPASSAAPTRVTPTPARAVVVQQAGRESIASPTKTAEPTIATPTPTIAAPELTASPLPAPPTIDAFGLTDAPAPAPAPSADAPPPTTTTTPSSIDTTTRTPIDARPKPPIVLSRAEDLALAIEQLRPIPRGGATLEVEAPGLGAIRLHVVVDGETVKIRIHAGSDAIAWFAREHDGLCSAARQAVPESQSVDLQLQTGSDARGNQPQPHARTYAGNDEKPQPHRAGAPSARSEAPASPTSPRSLVDVLA